MHGYDLFISYAQAAQAELADALQKRLQVFSKPWYRRRAMRIFRDVTHLSAQSGLNAAIEKALLASGHFLYIGSPAAAGSVWVGREIEAWLKNKPISKLLIVIADGIVSWDDTKRDFDKQSNAIHPALFGRFAEQPLWVNLNWASEKVQLFAKHPNFTLCIAKLASAIHNKALDEVIGEDLRAHRRTRILAGSIVALLFSIAAAATIAAFVAVFSNKRSNERAEVIERSFPVFSQNVGKKPGFIDMIRQALGLTKVQEATVDWGPKLLATKRDCDISKKSETRCPKSSASFLTSGLRSDILGLSEISAELSSAISIRDASCLAFSLDKELDEASEEFLADTVAEQALILLPEAAWTSLGKSKVDAESTLESSHSFQIWRTRIRENSPSELILIKLEMGSHCGSGGCENVLLGFLAVDSVYQLVLVQVGDLNEGVVLVRQYKEDEMPEIFTATMRQTGRSDQTRRVRTYQFVSRSNCYEAFLNGRVKSIELPFDNEEKRIPHKILRD